MAEALTVELLDWKLVSLLQDMSALPFNEATINVIMLKVKGSTQGTKKVQNLKEASISAYYNSLCKSRRDEATIEYSISGTG